MLKSNEIFARMPPEAAAELFTYLNEKQKPLYKATIDALAKQRKLRPIFVERKPRAERHVWMQDILGKKQNEGTAAHLLQMWLVGGQSKLLCEFLDGFGIAHDEDGTVENLPPAPPKEDVVRVVESLLASHPAGVVAVYLHAFQTFDENGWPTLAELLVEDERLHLSKAAA